MKGVLAAAVALIAGCRSSTDTTGDGGGGPDADVAPISQGVAIGVFGVPSPDNGVEDPAFFVGCPTAGLAAVDVFYILPSSGAIDEGTHVATFTRTGTHDHIAIGTSLVADLDEQGADPQSAPFVYPAMVTSDPTFLDLAEHSFSAHVLNPAMPDFNTLGTWNPYLLVACPD